ncbi:hypothetical protein B0H14DRAFT_2566872 [Mycena olivaceomarginata]|nr:hypothetical protein B0H14DRAFT_2566872 [Mycena olivaceomarginata]
MGVQEEMTPRIWGCICYIRVVKEKGQKERSKGAGDSEGTNGITDIENTTPLRCRAACDRLLDLCSSHATDHIKISLLLPPSLHPMSATNHRGNNNNNVGCGGSSVHGNDRGQVVEGQKAKGKGREALVVRQDDNDDEMPKQAANQRALNTQIVVLDEEMAWRMKEWEELVAVSGMWDSSQR